MVIIYLAAGDTDIRAQKVIYKPVLAPEEKDIYNVHYIPLLRILGFTVESLTSDISTIEQNFRRS